jgi:DNA polymerase-1
VTVPPTWCVLGGTADGELGLVRITADGPDEAVVLDPTDLPAEVARREREERPRWVWSDASARYPSLLAAGVRVERCHDLRLVHRILRYSARVPSSAAVQQPSPWDTPLEVPAEAGPDASSATLFDLPGAAAASSGVPQDLDEALAEFARHQQVLEDAADGGRLRLLAAAESAGALIGQEMHTAGLPWDVVTHDRILTEQLGPRPGTGQTPALMAQAAREVREALGDPMLSLDSPPRLLRALHRAEIPVSSTSHHELERHEHPAIAPLLRYKKLSRLLTANGWAWMDEWVRDGRYRPVYVPAGVVTGRWASSGGGALQIPRQLRPAIRADQGWSIIGADVSQLEPRVLAAMSGDRAMAEAGAGRDLYAGIVEAGIVSTRAEAKVGVLGALYGGTTGDSARVVPRLRENFPDAMRLVDEAAATGERGGTVTTCLGRSSPPPDPAWESSQRSANLPEATGGEQDRARRSARDRGRFTRNFVVQGTAAEWALAWLATIRRELARLDPVPQAEAAAASGPALGERAHLVFFLHDEVMVHAPAAQADTVAQIIRDAADEAGRLLFPGSPVDFPLDLQIGASAAEK